ncbi:MAG: hypothetical protein SCH71_09155 [Desulfobulbaceae bacterium]|nr:hypothetical protein [Desulfobulbaceae bacterium]
MPGSHRCPSQRELYRQYNVRGIVSIYSGQITDWGHFGADGKIYAVGREPGDSCLLVLNKMLPGFNNIVQPKVKTIYNTPEALSTLMQHRKTIGFSPYP